MRKRFLTGLLAVLAFGVLAAPSQAFIGKDEGLFIAVAKRDQNLHRHLAFAGYPSKHIRPTFPSSCYSAYWDGQFEGGCWKRNNNDSLTYDLATRYQGFNYPASYYRVQVFRYGCIQAWTSTGSRIFWPDGRESAVEFSGCA